MWFMWNLYGYLGGVQLLECIVFGERAINSTAHKTKRMAVIVARLTGVWFLVLYLWAALT